jgi:hypothetical protein
VKQTYTFWFVYFITLFCKATELKKKILLVALAQSTQGRGFKPSFWAVWAREDGKRNFKFQEKVIVNFSDVYVTFLLIIWRKFAHAFTNFF